jgi:hypothetical protein
MYVAACIASLACDNAYMYVEVPYDEFVPILKSAIMQRARACAQPARILSLQYSTA